MTYTEAQLLGRRRASEKWRRANKAQKAANQARYRERHPEYAAAWREQHPDYGSQWKVANPERQAASTHRRRARLRAAHTEEFLASEIFERDGWTCQLCFEPIDPTLRNRHPRMASLDHIKPISKGGDHTRDNVQASHYSCNARKGATVAE
jgi:5-methylcytosine-specific restriction endonuclease McrA